MTWKFLRCWLLKRRLRKLDQEQRVIEAELRGIERNLRLWRSVELEPERVVYLAPDELRVKRIEEAPRLTNSPDDKL